MYNPIEIPDSDDEMPEPTMDVAKSINSDSELYYEHTPEKQRKISASSSPEAYTTAATTAPDSASSDTAGSSPSMVNSGSSSNSLQMQTQVRHRSRKTQHRVRNAAAENEIQFESIPLDDDDDDVGRTVKRPAAPHGEENSEGNLKSRIGTLLNTDEVQEVIQLIANERVRCNFLLATYHLPDINFALNNPVKLLKYQFQESLKQRKERVNSVNPPSIASNTATSSSTANATITGKSEKL